MTQYHKPYLYINIYGICTSPLIYKVYYLIAEDWMSLTSSVLAESVLAITHILLFFMFAKPLVVSVLPRMELQITEKSLPNSSFSQCLKDWCSAYRAQPLETSPWSAAV